jgi:cytochrome c oxidase cbb3-type subunit 2
VPYSQEQVDHAAADVRAQTNPDDKNVDEFLKRYPKATVRDFDGKPGRITEMDALVADARHPGRFQAL